MEQQQLEKLQKKQYNYFIPDVLGKVMMRVPLNVQLEANLLSMTFMSIGLIVTITYLVIYTQFEIWYKIFLVLNGIAGIMFFTSSIISTFQQYNNVMEVMEFQKAMKGGK